MKKLKSFRTGTDKFIITRESRFGRGTENDGEIEVSDVLTSFTMVNNKKQKYTTVPVKKKKKYK